MHGRATGGWRWLVAGALCLVLGAGGAGARLWADDVPAAARKDYDAARAAYLKGDAKSLAAAFSALSQGKGKAGESVDFWELFVRVWRANKKPEADLWEKLIAPREQATPQSPTFDLVRFRVETDAAKKRGHLEKAVAKDPKAAGPRLLLARELRAQGEDDDAEEVVDKLIEEQPGLEEALVTKVDLLLASGLSRLALGFAEEQLAKQECPGLRHALALAQRNLVAEDAGMRAKALANAEKAVAARSDPGFVATLADLLDESDRLPEAVALLRKHAGATPDARISARLGDFAWRAGDYDEAVKHLALAASSDLRAAYALGLAHARRNRPKEARAAFDRVLALDKDAWPRAVAIARELNDPALMRTALSGRDGPLAQWMRGAADASEGRVAEVTRLWAEPASSGTRAGEEELSSILFARLVQKLGAKHAAHARAMRDLRAQAVAKGVAAARPPSQPPEVKARSAGYLLRSVTYMRSICGSWFEVKDTSMALTVGDNSIKMSLQVTAAADCAGEPTREINLPLGEGGSFSAEGPGEAGWRDASAAFKEGCAALVQEDYAKAAEALGKVVDLEPAWQRARVLRSFAQAFLPAADLRTVAREALEAAQANPDDWAYCELAIELGVLAGHDITSAARALFEHVDARSRRPLAEL